MKIRYVWIVFFLLISIPAQAVFHEFEYQLSYSEYHYLNSSFSWSTMLNLGDKELIIGASTRAWDSWFLVSPHWQEWDLYSGIYWTIISQQNLVFSVHTLGGIRIGTEWERIFKSSSYAGVSVAPLINAGIDLYLKSWEFSFSGLFTFFQDGLWIEPRTRIVYRFTSGIHLSLEWVWINGYLWAQDTHTDNHFLGLGLGIISGRR